ncbi:hypothetical protein BHM03_00030262 [Ensete ventricosum]|nr:hypothetical protein BHM03_00030262 [Ensete ventricosum]
MTVLAMASGSLRSSPGVKLAALGLPSLWCYSLRRFRSGVATSSKTRLLCFSFPGTPVDVDIATRINIYDDGPNRRCINANMSLQVLSNSLRYFLRRPTTEEASF